MVQLSHQYTATGKTIALAIGHFVGKVMSLLFNILSKFIITFLPRSKHLLISWLQSLMWPKLRIQLSLGNGPELGIAVSY